MNNHPKNQHFVPRFLLNNFCNIGTEKLFVFDKHTLKVFESNIRNLASEREFYDFELAGQRVTLEYGLANLEYKSSEIINKLIKEKSLAWLSESDKLTIACFIAAQFSRVKSTRLRYKSMNEKLKEKIVDLGFDPKSTEGYKDLSDNDVKALSSRMAVKGDFVPYFMNKIWFLLETEETNPFFISDNPVVLQNYNDLRPYGNLGLCVKGIEIYIPLSKTLTLAMFCPSHKEAMEDTYKKYSIIKSLRPDMLPKGEETEILLRYISALNTGNSLKIVSDNVINLNSLQVGFSSRFVYSCQNNFDLVKKILDNDPKCKDGIDFEMN